MDGKKFSLANALPVIIIAFIVVVATFRIGFLKKLAIGNPPAPSA